MYDPNLPRSRVFLPAVLGGVLLYLCYFPVNAGFLAWVALVPFLFLLRANARPRRIYLAAFVGGLSCYLPAIQWIRVAHPAMYAAWIFLAIYCALCLVLSLWLSRKLGRAGLPLWLAVPVAFVAVEYARSHFPTGYAWMKEVGLWHPIGFGWYALGHTQHESLSLIQTADLTGVYGLTFLVALVNAVFWLALERTGRVRAVVRQFREPPPSSYRPVLTAAALLLLAVGYGTVKLSHDPFAEGPRVALIQGNLPQDVKNEHGKEMEEHFGRLADKAARPPAGEPRPDLVVWPETSFVDPWFDFGPGANPEEAPFEFRRNANAARHFFAGEMRFAWRTPTLFGLSTFQWEADGKPWRYNSALLIDHTGEVRGRYDKVHLVPWGEYVPLEKTLPFLKAFTPYEGDYSCRPGESWTRFPLPVGDRTYHFACLICYEDTDPTLARQYVRPSAEGVDFFVNISNDGWFRGTAEHEQHLAIGRFRAVETRRAIVRAVNMGISAIIDPDGRVVALPGPTWAESKKVEAVVRGPVPLDARTTLYARLGDWVPVGCWLVVLGGFVRGYVRRKRPAAA